MKLNRWTIGLATVGLVSLPAGLLADEAVKMNPVNTLVSSTTIGGYVDTSAQWNFGTGNANTAAYSFGKGKADGFNLNVVKVSVSKPLDEAQWAAGYQVDMLYGPDAAGLGTLGFDNEIGLQQAYVVLRTPVGNGLDLKAGVFNTIIGYESFNANLNPNWTRSYGFTMEPTTHEGVLASYQFADWLTAQGGVANTFGPTVGERADRAESYKTYMGSLAFTAPKDTGFLEGSTLYLGFVNGFNSADATGTSSTDTHLYAGFTMNTPVKNLKWGTAFDYAFLSSRDNVDDASGYMWAVAGYLSFQLTEKMSLHGRAEYFSRTGEDYIEGFLPSRATEVTATLQYDLWKNVISRIEYRWDHSADGSNQFGGSDAGDPTRKNQHMLAANVIYQF